MQQRRPINPTWLPLLFAGILAGGPGRAEAPRPGPAAPSARQAAAARAAAWQDRPLQRGLVLGVYSDGEGDRFRQDLREIRALGASHVLLLVPHAQADVRSHAIGPREWLTPSRPRLTQVIREARSLGLGVWLMPTLYLEDTSDGQWRGTIAPDSWDAWWRSYSAFILDHARLAGRLGVEVFCIGSELCSTENQRERWAELALRVRRETPSLLAYSFNWDHYDAGNIADLVDLAGINAYWDLPPATAATVEDMARSWEPRKAAVRRWARAHGRPVVFTEVGYRSVVGAEIHPWDYLEDLDYDGDSQRRCYEAFLRAWTGFPGLAGVFFHAWRGDGGPGDTGYTPRGKPAEAILERFLADAEHHHETREGRPAPAHR